MRRVKLCNDKENDVQLKGDAGDVAFVDLLNDPYWSHPNESKGGPAQTLQAAELQHRVTPRASGANVHIIQEAASC